MRRTFFWIKRALSRCSRAASRFSLVQVHVGEELVGAGELGMVVRIEEPLLDGEHALQQAASLVGLWA